MHEPALVSEMSSSSSSSEVSARDMPAHATWVAPTRTWLALGERSLFAEGETQPPITNGWWSYMYRVYLAARRTRMRMARRGLQLPSASVLYHGAKRVEPVAMPRRSAPHVEQWWAGALSSELVLAYFVMRTPPRNYQTLARSDACGDASHFSFASWRPPRDYRRHPASWLGSSSFFCRASVPSVDANSGSRPRSG